MKQGPIRLVVLNGAPQVSGTVAKIGKQMIAAAKREARFHGFPLVAKMIHLNRVMKGFHQGRFDFPRWLRSTFNELDESDIIGYISPVNSYTVSALMKNMLDYQYSFERDDGTHVLDGKVAIVAIHGHEDCATKAAHDMSGNLNDCGLHRPPHSIGVMIKGGKDRSENYWQFTEHLLAAENGVRAHIKLNVDNTIDVNSWDIRYIPPKIRAEIERLKRNERRRLAYVKRMRPERRRPPRLIARVA